MGKHWAEADLFAELEAGLLGKKEGTVEITLKAGDTAVIPGTTKRVFADTGIIRYQICTDGMIQIVDTISVRTN